MNENNEKDKIGFGLASLILGAAAVLLFSTCVNFMLIILAVVFGIIQLAMYQKKGMAIAGLIMSGISLLLSIVFWIIVFTNMDLRAYFGIDQDQIYEYEDNFYDEFWEEYDGTYETLTILPF